MGLNFLTNTDAQEKISALELQISNHDQEMEAKNAEVKEAHETAASEKEKREAAEAEAASLREELEQSEAALTSAATRISELERANAELSETLTDEDGRVAEKAAKQLAESGHPPVEGVGDENATGTLSREDYEAQSAAITDARERARWRLANMHRVKN